VHFSRGVANIHVMDNSVERLHLALVRAIEQTRAGDLDRPVTVSEIYQQLIPYRAARAAVGFDMNADYEYALLRLLAGEGNFARLEPGEVRETLRSELESPNPNVSLFREYANCDVWISPPPEWPAQHAQNEAAPDLLPKDEPDTEVLPREPRAAASSPAAELHECAFCGGDLPPGRLANFCPHCGNDLSQRPCATCGEILEPMWRFCANCGTRVPGYDAEAN
jgi:hypothetical protein